MAEMRIKPSTSNAICYNLNLERFAPASSKAPINCTKTKMTVFRYNLQPGEKYIDGAGLVSYSTSVMYIVIL